jgi:hypothetical protein
LIGVSTSRAKFERVISSLDIAKFAQSFAELIGEGFCVLIFQDKAPMRGIFDCCARAASGHAAAAPPSSVMNSRRFIP